MQLEGLEIKLQELQELETLLPEPRKLIEKAREIYQECKLIGIDNEINDRAERFRTETREGSGFEFLLRRTTKDWLKLFVDLLLKSSQSRSPTISLGLVSDEDMPRKLLCLKQKTALLRRSWFRDLLRWCAGRTSVAKSWPYVVGDVVGMNSDGNVLTVAYCRLPSEFGESTERKHKQIRLTRKTIVTYHGVSKNGAAPTLGYGCVAWVNRRGDQAAQTVVLVGNAAVDHPDVRLKVDEACRGRIVRNVADPGSAPAFSGTLIGQVRDENSITIKVRTPRNLAGKRTVVFNDKTVLAFSAVGKDGAHPTPGYYADIYLDPGEPEDSKARVVHFFGEKLGRPLPRLQVAVRLSSFASTSNTIRRLWAMLATQSWIADRIFVCLPEILHDLETLSEDMWSWGLARFGSIAEIQRFNQACSPFRRCREELSSFSDMCEKDCLYGAFLIQSCFRPGEGIFSIFSGRQLLEDRMQEYFPRNVVEIRRTAKELFRLARERFSLPAKKSCPTQRKRLAVEIAIGHIKFNLRIKGPQFKKHLRITVDAELLTAFVERIKRNAPGEPIPFDEFSPPGTSNTHARAPAALRSRISDLNKRLNKWHKLPDEAPWICSERREGYVFNTECVEWSLHKDFRPSVELRPTDPKTIERNTPNNKTIMD